MKIRGRDINLKFFLWYYCFNGLIIVDMFLITISIIFQLPNSVVTDIRNFDFVVCLILLGEYALNLYMSSPKKDFIMDPMNIIGLIASIPFDAILVAAVPGSGLLRYLRLFKLSRIFLLSSRLKFIKELFEKTGLHKILAGLFATIIIFTALFHFAVLSFGELNDLYFVIVTLTTVGYGDLYPQTHNGKVLTIILILIGIFVFSTITAAMSSFLTDRIIEADEEEITDVLEGKYDDIINELKLIREENKQLHDELMN